MVSVIRKYGLIILLHFIIGDGLAQGHLFSEVSINRSSVYVGQPVEVTVSVFTSTWFTSGVEPGNQFFSPAVKKWFQHSQKGGCHAIIAITTRDPEGEYMATIEPTLFSWQDVETTSDLDRFILVHTIIFLINVF